MKNKFGKFAFAAGVASAAFYVWAKAHHFYALGEEDVFFNLSMVCFVAPYVLSTLKSVFGGLHFLPVDPVKERRALLVSPYSADAFCGPNNTRFLFDYPVCPNEEGNT